MWESRVYLCGREGAEGAVACTRAFGFPAVLKKDVTQR